MENSPGRYGDRVIVKTNTPKIISTLRGANYLNDLLCKTAGRAASPEPTAGREEVLSGNSTCAKNGPEPKSRGKFLARHETTAMRGPYIRGNNGTSLRTRSQMRCQLEASGFTRCFWSAVSISVLRQRLKLLPRVAWFASDGTLCDASSDSIKSSWFGVSGIQPASN